MSDQQNNNSTNANQQASAVEITENNLQQQTPAVSDDQQQDSVVRFLFEQHGVRGEIVHMHQPITTLLANLSTYPQPIKSLMLELASAAVLIAATLKTDGTVTVQIQGGRGPNALNFAFINIDKNLNFYGNASWDQEKADKFKGKEEEANKLSFADLVGNGGILVISAFPENGVRYQGIVALDQDNLSRCLEEYFKDSEQLPTTLQLYHDIDQAQSGGLMLQIIPNIEHNIESLAHLSTLSATLTAEELFSLSLHESLRRLYWNDQIVVYQPEPVDFKCVCSKERILNAIRGLPLDELEELAQEEKGIDMTCHSCGKVYHVDMDEIKIIYAAARDELEKNGTPDGSATVANATGAYQDK